jgi:hypothetical protein
MWSENPLIPILLIPFVVFYTNGVLHYYQVLDMLNPIAKSPSKNSF